VIEAAKIDVATLREAYRAKKLALFDTLRFARAPTRSVHTVLRQLSALADQTLCTLWQEADFGDSLTLAAVGGFGRGELFPYSDVDVLLLLPPEGDAATIDPARIEAFIGHCWDAGLEIGSSVRTVEECLAEAEKDVTVQTSLLEARLIAGNKRLFTAFRRRFTRAIDPQAFFVAKTQELRQRHQKYDNTPYALEPNCKESPGRPARSADHSVGDQARPASASRWDDLAKNGLADLVRGAADASATRRCSRSSARGCT
jgi:[protein-PII] uridylyltransferase